MNCDDTNSAVAWLMWLGKESIHRYWCQAVGFHNFLCQFSTGRSIFPRSVGCGCQVKNAGIRKKADFEKKKVMSTIYYLLLKNKKHRKGWKVIMSLPLLPSPKCKRQFFFIGAKLYIQWGRSRKGDSVPLPWVYHSADQQRIHRY